MGPVLVVNVSFLLAYNSKLPKLFIKPHFIPYLMILDDSIDNHLDITPIPIKVMQNDYYTNWLPIQQINVPSSQHSKMPKAKSKVKEGKALKAGQGKRVGSKPRIACYDDEYSYFKMWW